jgi:chemotaxis protein methyltransferase CheR
MANRHASYPILEKAARVKILGKSPTQLYLRLNKRIWQRLPDRWHDLRVVRSYGAWLHALVCLHANRQQYFGTFFFRNRPSLELMRRLAEQKNQGATLNIAVLACSVGAEVYSILWTIRSARPDLKVRLQAVDVSKEILDFAAKGVYSPSTSKMVGSSIFDRMTEQEQREMFDWEGDRARVKSWLREGVIWRCGDATDPESINGLGLQDMVIGSNFLCHMAPEEAETCLRNIARLVSPGGHLFVAGVDLGVRTRVALDQGWKPLRELMAEIHDGDPSVRADWPWQWWGLEPFDRRRSDWQVRYAAVFQVN